MQLQAALAYFGFFSSRERSTIRPFSKWHMPIGMLLFERMLKMRLHYFPVTL
jgi:hypothetical protein